MKKIITVSFATLLIAVACKSKQGTSVSTSNDVAVDAQLAAVKARFADATKDELLKGRAVYTGPCTKCHRSKGIMIYTEEKLLSIVDNMAVRAKISTEEKQALIRFAIGLRATAKK